MSFSEKIVSGLAIAVLITGFASCAFPKLGPVNPFGSPSTSQALCSPAGNSSVLARNTSFERQCGHG